MNRKMTSTKASCREKNLRSNGPRAERKKRTAEIRENSKLPVSFR